MLTARTEPLAEALRAQKRLARLDALESDQLERVRQRTEQRRRALLASLSAPAQSALRSVGVGEEPKPEHDGTVGP